MECDGDGILGRNMIGYGEEREGKTGGFTLASSASLSLSNGQQIVWVTCGENLLKKRLPSDHD